MRNVETRDSGFLATRLLLPNKFFGDLGETLGYIFSYARASQLAGIKFATSAGPWTVPRNRANQEAHRSPPTPSTPSSFTSFDLT